MITKLFKSYAYNLKDIHMRKGGRYDSDKTTLWVFWDLETIRFSLRGEQRVVYAVFRVYEVGPRFSRINKVTTYSKRIVGCGVIEGKIILNEFMEEVFQGVVGIAERKRRRAVFYIAHNFSGFDYTFILEYLALKTIDKKSIWNFQPLLVENKIYIIKGVAPVKFTVTFICSLLLLTRSLDSLRKDFGLRKRKIKYPIELLQDIRYVDPELKLIKPVINLQLFREDLQFKLKNNFPEYVVIEENTLLYEDILEYYCKLDVELLREVYHKFILGYFKENPDLYPPYRIFITAARLTMFTFIRKFGEDSNIKYIKYKSDLFDSLKASYQGGRTEVNEHWIVNEDWRIWHYDFPGIYGKIIQNKLPVGNPILYTPHSKEDINAIDISEMINYIIKEDKFAFIKCTAHVPPDIDLCVLPIFAEFTRRLIKKNCPEIIDILGSGGKLYFPAGDLTRCTWTHLEIKLALKLGVTFTKVIEVVIFETGTPLKEYSLLITAKKNEIKKLGKKREEKLYKILLNSLYGKFGRAFGERKETHFKPWDELREAMNVSIENNIDKKGRSVKVKCENWKIVDNVGIYTTEVKRTWLKTSYENISLSSAISSMGRVALAEIILELKKHNKGIKFKYCDTDSVFIEYYKQPFHPAILDKEWTNYSSGIFLSPKRYILWGEDPINAVDIKIKGVNKKSAEMHLKGWRYKHFINEIGRCEIQKYMMHFEGNLKFNKNLKKNSLDEWIGITIQSVGKKLIPFKFPKRIINFITGETSPYVWRRLLDICDKKKIRMLAGRSTISTNNRRMPWIMRPVGEEDELTNNLGLKVVGEQAFQYGDLQVFFKEEKGNKRYYVYKPDIDDSDFACLIYSFLEHNWIQERQWIKITVAIDTLPRGLEWKSLGNAIIDLGTLRSFGREHFSDQLTNFINHFENEYDTSNRTTHVDYLQFIFLMKNLDQKE